jgi:hypothetical protein
LRGGRSWVSWAPSNETAPAHLDSTSARMGQSMKSHTRISRSP